MCNNAYINNNNAIVFCAQQVNFTLHWLCGPHSIFRHNFVQMAITLLLLNALFKIIHVDRPQNYISNDIFGVAVSKILPIGKCTVFCDTLYSIILL